MRTRARGQQNRRSDADVLMCGPDANAIWMRPTS